jgi:hypothetical protein
MAALVTMLVPAVPADASPYSGNHHIRAHLSPVRKCFSDLTIYTVKLVNRSDRAHHFRAYELGSRGQMVTGSEQRTRVPAHSSRRITAYVATGHPRTMVVVFRNEVLVARKLSGLCSGAWPK